MLRELLDRFLESLLAKFSARKYRQASAFPSHSSWEDWELDPEFFTALSRWTLRNPESSLDRILKKICVGIDLGKGLLELVPDSPFPARGLIGALVHLLQLGVTLSKATKDVQKFARDIVRWVEGVRFAFKQDKSGRFTSRTWQNLAEMRNLIDEICKWSKARLDDGRWSRAMHGLSVAKEIDEFKSRLSTARAIFMDLSVINLSEGQDAIIQGHYAIIQRHDAMIQAIRDLIVMIQQAQAAQLSSILDELEAQNQAESRRQFLSQMLSKHALTNTAYDDQGKRPCDEETRVDILADIQTWVHDTSDDAQRFLWLTGDPGSGKSAVAASTARQCKDEKILWAQFFINRNIGETTNPASYFPSIARQLADRSPDVALAIHDALKEQPSLIDDISQRQAGKLFVESLKVASSMDRAKPVVVMIDGLDETDASRLRATAEIFSKALVGLPKNAKVMIASRTEDDIRKPFSATFRNSRVKHIHLDTSAESSIQDVSMLLVKKIAEVVFEEELDPSEWPGDEQMAMLCKQASGLFIWAVTVIKFIQDQVKTLGRECLGDLLDELNSKGMGDINALYGTILRLTYKNQTDPWVFETFRRVVGCIVVLQEPLSVSEIKILLDLRKTPQGVPVDINHFIRRLRTVLVAGADAINDDTVPRLHKSFFEYITSQRAEARFCIDMSTSNGEVAMQCIRQLAALVKPSTTGFSPWLGFRSGRTNAKRHRFPTVARYASRFLPSHLPQGEGETAGVVTVGPITLPELQVLFRLPLHDRVQPPTINVSHPPDGKTFVSSFGHDICIWDSKSGAHSRYPVKCHRTVSAVAYSPNGGQIISVLWDNTLRLWDARSGRPIGSLLEGHTKSVHAVAYSPDGNQIISGSSDKTLRLWDARSCQPIGLPLRGHTGPVRAVAYSPDGKHIVSGSEDETLRLWDARSGQPIGAPLTGHTHCVSSVAYSPDGSQIISSSFDNTLRLWDARSGQPIRSPLQGHTGRVNAVAYSPDGSQIISGSSDRTLRLWDARSCQPIGLPLKGHTGFVWAVAYSPDGSQIVSSSLDKTIRLWDARNGQPIRSPIQGHTDVVNTVAYSPDGSQIISGSWDMTIRLWDGRSGQSIVSPLTGHTDKLTSIALSPDGKIVSASSDETVCLWGMTGKHVSHIKNVNSLVFSPDGRHFAAISLDKAVYLWDAESCQILSSYRKDHINCVTVVSFSRDGTQLMTSCIDGTVHRWDATTGKAHEISQSSYSEKSFCFSMERGWCRDDTDGALLRWFPADNADFGVWTYIDGTVVRINSGGLSTVIMDMSEILPRE